MNEVKMKPKTSKRNFFVKWFLLFTTVIVIVVFAIAQPAFFTVGNMLDIVRSSVTLAMLAMGLVFVFAVGEIDFSAGSLMSMSAVTIGMIMDNPFFSDKYPLAIFLTILVLAGFGLANGLLVVKVRMPAFIATLGMSTMITGIAKYMTGGGYYISNNWTDSFTAVGQGFTFGVIPNPVWVLIIVGVIAYLIMEKTKIGRYFYAVGSNAVASGHVGINVQRTKILSFVLCAVFISVAGIVAASTLRTASAQIGAESLLGGLSALLLGATFLRPGVINVPGAILGAVLLTVISNGLIMINASFYMKDIVQASILLISVGFNSIINKSNVGAIKTT